MNEQPPTSLVRYRTELEAAIARELASKRRHRLSPLRRPRYAIAYASALTVLALAITLIVAPGGSSSLIAQAYAAINSNNAVIHFVETAHYLPNPTGDKATADVWMSGKRSRSVITVHRPDAPPQLRFDRHVIVVDGSREAILRDGHLRTLTVRDGLIVTATATDDQCAPLLGFCNGAIGDPLATVSDLYREGHLHAAGTEMVHGRRLDVITGTITNGARRRITVRLFVAPKRAIPVEVVEIFSTTRRLTALISQYQRLPLTPRTKRLLTLHAEQTR